MLDRVSALAGIAPFEGEGVSLHEAEGFELSQLAGDVKALKQSLPRLPEKIGVVVEYAGKKLFRIGPHQIWLLGHAPDMHEGVFVTPLTSSRTRIAISGQRARGVLAKCAAIDFHAKVFTPGNFAMTGIHHMPVLIHCTGADSFHIYILRTFARSLWEVLTDAGHS